MYTNVWGHALESRSLPKCYIILMNTADEQVFGEFWQNLFLPILILPWIVQIIVCGSLRSSFLYCVELVPTSSTHSSPMAACSSFLSYQYGAATALKIQWNTSSKIVDRVVVAAASNLDKAQPLLNLSLRHDECCDDGNRSTQDT